MTRDAIILSLGLGSIALTAGTPGTVHAAPSDIRPLMSVERPADDGAEKPPTETPATR